MYTYVYVTIHIILRHTCTIDILYSFINIYINQYWGYYVGLFFKGIKVSA